MVSSHIIKKQILDVNLDTDIGSFLFKSELAEIYYTELLPLLEACCDEISGSEEIYRIDRLEIDLGNIDQNNLVEELKHKVQKQFSEALDHMIESMPTEREKETAERLLAESSAFVDSSNDDISANHQVDYEETEFELLSCFLKKGRLPWWHRKEKRADIHAIMEKLLNDKNLQLKQLLLEVINDSRSIKRVVYQFSDTVLERTVSFFGSQNGALINQTRRELVTTLAGWNELQSIPQQQVRHEIWISVFKTMVAGQPDDLENKSFLFSTVERLSEQLQINPDKLMDHVLTEHRLKPSPFPNGPAPQKELVDIVELESVKALRGRKNDLKRLFDILENNLLVTRFPPTKMTGLNKVKPLLVQAIEHIHRTSDQTASADHLKDHVTPVLKGWTNLVRHLDDLANDFVDVLNDKSTAMDIQLATLIRSALEPIQELLSSEVNGRKKSRSGVPDEIGKPEARETTELETNNDPLRKDDWASQPDDGKDLTDFNPSARDAEQTGLTNHEETPDSPRKKRKTYNDLFAQAEEFYVANAGIVLFWPYLERFLESLGIMENSRFIDQTQQERAAVIIQYLASGSETCEEYDLSLNKILCGLDPETPIPSTVPLTDAEKAESNTLVSTLIRHWSVLKDMSPAGLRKMFLLREGMITNRDGNWVLRVAEQAYDVLIDKMPWQISMIKLPWMTNLIFVEWRL